MTRARGTLPWLLLAATTLPLAATPPDLGEMEYTVNCMTCHGVGGHGNGPLAGFGTPVAADLTRLSSRQGGSFPYVTVYETIEGTRRDLKPGSAMPAWKDYYYEDAERAGPLPPHEVEGYLRTRIMAIMQYLAEIQE
jgi:mono/diheme cytochrome c family protein